MAFVALAPEDLRIGLYIKLECSWWNHPFAKSKFKITSQKEISTLRAIRKGKLFYDPDLSDSEPTQLTQNVPDHSDEVSDTDSRPSSEVAEQKSSEEIRQERIHACRMHSAELEKAGFLYQQALSQTKIALKRINDGHAGGLKSAHQVVKSVGEALKHKDTAMAIIDVVSSTDSEERFVAHSLNVGILSMVVGQELGVQEEDLLILGVGALLHDIGKAHLPAGLRSKHVGLTPQERQEWLRHPKLGKETVERFTAFPAAGVDIVYQHQERLNGTGFPRGLAGNQISFFAKIVMVVDEYDNLCNQADVEKNLTPAEALSYLYQDGKVQEKGEFSEDVIIALVRVLGVYPPGTVVELDNGRYGLVTGVNFEDRTKPRIMLWTPDFPKEDAMVIDLAEEECVIVHSLHPRQLPQTAQEYFFSSRVAV